MIEIKQGHVQGPLIKQTFAKMPAVELGWLKGPRCVSETRRCAQFRIDKYITNAICVKLGDVVLHASVYLSHCSPLTQCQWHYDPLVFIRTAVSAFIYLYFGTVLVFDATQTHYVVWDLLRLDDHRSPI